MAWGRIHGTSSLGDGVVGVLEGRAVARGHPPGTPTPGLALSPVPGGTDLSRYTCFFLIKQPLLPLTAEDDHQGQHRRCSSPLPLALQGQMALAAQAPGQSLPGLRDCAALHGQKANRLAASVKEGAQGEGKEERRDEREIAPRKGF